MQISAFHKKYMQLFREKYPEISGEISESYICQETIQLPLQLKNQIENFIKEAFQARLDPEYVKLFPEEKDVYVPNFSVLMSYDFHLNHENELKLIEINTDSGGYPPCSLLYTAQGIVNNSEELIMQSYIDEYQLVHPNSLPNYILLTDVDFDHLHAIQYEMYKQLFQDRGYNAEIAPLSEIAFDQNEEYLTHNGTQIDLLANYDLDFYYREEQSMILKKALNQHKTVITPNPHEYLLLSDKHRLNILSTHNSFSEDSKQMFLKVSNIADLDPNELWKSRKKYYFKPPNLYQGKQVYSGKKITTKVFNRIIKEDFIAQELVEPQKIMIRDPEGEEIPFKFDIRAFAYKDQVQMFAARVYRGQTTNMQHPLGGFAAIEFV